MKATINNSKQMGVAVRQKTLLTETGSTLKERVYPPRPLGSYLGIYLTHVEYHGSPSFPCKNLEILSPINLPTLSQSLTKRKLDKKKMKQNQIFLWTVFSRSQNTRPLVFMHNNVCGHWRHCLELYGSKNHFCFTYVFWDEFFQECLRISSF